MFGSKRKLPTHVTEETVSVDLSLFSALSYCDLARPQTVTEQQLPTKKTGKRSRRFVSLTKWSPDTGILKRES